MFINYCNDIFIRKDHIPYLYGTVSPRAKKSFELKYMQHIVIIYWLCITYTLCQLKLFNVTVVTVAYTIAQYRKYRVSKGISLSLPFGPNA